MDSDHIGIAAIDAAMDDLAERQQFSLDQLIERLDGTHADAVLKERLERLLEGDDRFFNAGGDYITRAKFFTGATFVVTPTDFEMEQGILIPGHRLSTFMAPDIFPSEATLTIGGKAVGMREFQGTLQELFHYHLLLGSEQVFDFLMADHPGNAFLRQGTGAGAQVTINVFDMARFYHEHEFESGDALLCTVEDYASGTIRAEYLDGGSRKEHERHDWVNRFGKDLDKVIDRFANYLELSDQLRWAFYFGGDTLWGAQAASLDEFVRTEVPFEIDCESGYTVFVRRSEAGGAEAPESPSLPDGLSISSGTTGSLEEILEECGSHVSPNEIDAYILDGCFYREEDFSGFIGRCFGAGKLHFSDDTQQMVFENFLEERFEMVRESYDRAADEPRAELRSVMLEAIDQRLELFDLLENIGVDPSTLPEDGFKTLRDVRNHFNRIFLLLNDLKHELGSGEADSLAHVIDQLCDQQSAAVEKIESAIADLNV